MFKQAATNVFFEIFVVFFIYISKSTDMEYMKVRKAPNAIGISKIPAYEYSGGAINAIKSGPTNIIPAEETLPTSK